MQGSWNISPLQTETAGVDSRGRLQYRLIAPLTVRSHVNGGGIVVEVPAGFVTDGASTPRLLWSIFPPAGRYAPAAAVHDYFCTTRCISRFLADAIFRDLMMALGVPLWKRWLMWAGVRISIWRHWR